MVVVVELATECLDALSWGVAILLLLLAAGELVEVGELYLRHEHRPHPPGLSNAPLVSVHLPIHAEPPEVVLASLRALQNAAYANYEVIVVDNNTTDESLWRPVEKFCHEAGERFRFIHVEGLAGFKAGALNLALANTCSEAEIVVVIDADYIVSSDFLTTLVPHFKDDSVAFVQAPQDYRQDRLTRMQASFYCEYAQFFAVGMRLRQPQNALHLHGTMVAIRRNALIGVGGWAQWCITEDCELGLRLLASGGRGVYVVQSLGRGLVPWSYRDFARQRRRWVMGGVQTLRHHWRALLLGDPVLTRAQRFRYLQGWVPWTRDAVFCVAVALLLAQTSRALVGQESSATHAIAVALLATTIAVAACQLYVTRCRLVRPWPQVLRTTLIVLGLVWTIGPAWFAGWRDRRLSFERTPKVATTGTFWISGQLLPLGVAFVSGFAVLAMASEFGSPDVTLNALALGATGGTAIASAGHAYLGRRVIEVSVPPAPVQRGGERLPVGCLDPIANDSASSASGEARGQVLRSHAT